jgi:ATP-binding cassette subfamily G (WHITE) protein 2
MLRFFFGFFLGGGYYSDANRCISFTFSLSRKGNTIIFSIHQPRYSIFKLFDHVCLLGDGHVMYNGPAHEAMDYFREIGKAIT